MGGNEILNWYLLVEGVLIDAFVVSHFSNKETITVNNFSCKLEIYSNNEIQK